MKKILASLLAVALPSALLFAEPTTVNRSSYVTVGHTGAIQGKYLDKVIVGAATSGGSLVIYDSTWTTNTQISSITLDAVAVYDFNNMAVKGIYYIADTPTNGVTILYKK